MKEQNIRPFGWRDKLGYAMGDMGCGFSFQLVSTFMQLFYLQYIGIKATDYAAIILISKIFDAPILEIDIRNIFSGSHSDIINLMHANIEDRNHEIPGRNFTFISIAILQAMQLFPKEQIDIYIGITKVIVDWLDVKKEFINKTLCLNTPTLYATLLL
jgi:7-cyano-7-deazaguanine synthase in queuosine biosynthesis